MRTRLARILIVPVAVMATLALAAPAAHAAPAQKAMTTQSASSDTWQGQSGDDDGWWNDGGNNNEPDNGLVINLLQLLLGGPSPTPSQCGLLQFLLVGCP